jgi:hypothetical protein
MFLQLATFTSFFILKEIITDVSPTWPFEQKCLLGDSAQSIFPISENLQKFFHEICCK